MDESFDTARDEFHQRWGQTFLAGGVVFALAWASSVVLNRAEARPFLEQSFFEGALAAAAGAAVAGFFHPWRGVSPSERLADAALARSVGLWLLALGAAAAAVVGYVHQEQAPGWWARFGTGLATAASPLAFVYFLASTNWHYHTRHAGRRDRE
ncbi:MAG: hypothetical protein SF028_05930 [Candidatus Sumerlaeia bacterium]|nr:hypothetical protein [Candidatus Sumerlaeia bacterium]